MLSALLREKYIFISILLINIAFVSILKFMPSMDGPAHLYNSNLLLSHIRYGFADDFFSVNAFYIPNWLSHVMLASFRIFLPGWLAEKCLIILYITGLSISFRLAVKQLNPGNIAYSHLIFPFIYSFLFHLGFYNYCLSFIFFFYAIYYWLKNRENHSIKVSLILCLLFILTFYSSMLTLLFQGLTLGILALSGKILKIKETSSGNPLKYLLRLLITSLPALVLLFLFYAKTDFPSTSGRIGTAELIKWIGDARPLIVYNYAIEKILTELIVYIFIGLFLISVYYRLFRLSSFKPELKDMLTLPALSALVLLFIIPSGGYAGMMSDRLALMFFMILLLFIATMNMPRNIRYILPLFIMIHFILLGYHFNVALRKLNDDAKKIVSSSSGIPSGSIVLPLDLTENWLGIHFSNYLGVEKDLIILENYEAYVGWFPIRWDGQNLPDIKLGEHSRINGISWIDNPLAVRSVQIDCIYLYGKITSINKPELAELRTVLNEEFTMLPPENDYIRIYMRR